MSDHSKRDPALSGSLEQVTADLSDQVDALFDTLFAGAEPAAGAAANSTPSLTSSSRPPVTIPRPSGSRLPAVPTPKPATAALREPRPLPLPTHELTARPPAVNPAGPARREPFNLSPRAPVVRSDSTPSMPKLGSARPSARVSSDSGELSIETTASDDNVESAAEPALSTPSATAKRETNWERASSSAEDGVAVALAQPDLSLPPSSWLALTHDKRAQLFEREAETIVDKAQQGRLLLIASEMWALAGSQDQARRTASRAAALLPSSSLAQMQARQLALLDRDWKTVSKSLDDEVLLSTSPEMQVHTLCLAADVRRVHLGDALGAAKKLEQASRIQSDDARAFVLRLAQELGGKTGAPTLRLPDTLENAPFAAALEQLRALRADKVNPTALEQDPFEQARRALKQGDRIVAAEALIELSKVDSLRDAALWLASALFAASPATRARSTPLLIELASRSPTPAVCRALVGRALDTANSEAMEFALARADKDSFAPLDALLLLVLCGAPATALAAPLARVEAEPSTAEYARAVAAALRLQEPVNAEGASDDSAAFDPAKLGRALASDNVSPALLKDTPAYSLGALRLEQHRRNHDTVGAAATLAAWAVGAADAIARDREIAAALLLEVAASRVDPLATPMPTGRDLLEDSRAGYRRALEHDRTFEALVRLQPEPSANPGQASGKVSSAALERLADSIGGERAAWLLVEAAYLASTSDVSHSLALLHKSITCASALPFAYHTADLIGRLRSDEKLISEWLSRHRKMVNSPLEIAIDCVREAALLNDHDAELAKAQLEQAALLFPNDLNLQRLAERAGKPGKSMGAAYNDELFERFAMLEGAPRTRCALLALSGLRVATTDLERALALFEEACALDPSSGIAAALRERVSDHSALPSHLRKLLEQGLKNELAASKVEHLERYLRLCVSTGRVADARVGSEALLQLVPDHLLALRTLESALLSLGNEAAFAPHAERLIALFDDDEAYAYNWYCLRVAGQGGRALEATELIDQVAQRPNAPYWLLRATESQARLRGDHEREARALERLLAFGGSEDDLSSLALRRAEVAAAQDQGSSVRQFLELSLNHVADNIATLDFKAAFHRRHGELRQAASTLSELARVSQVEEHRVESLLAAGFLFFDELGDAERGEATLEQVAALSPGNARAFERLREHYSKTHQRVKLTELLKVRIIHADTSEERARLEVLRAQVLVEIGEGTAAKAALSAALEANPEHTDALAAYARVALAERDFEAAEGAWIQLARITHDPEQQAEYFRALAELYSSALPNAPRAEVCYREVLKRLPHDTLASEHLVAVYERLGRPDKAIGLQVELLKSARGDDERARWTVRLAQIYELCAGDPKRAELTLQQARKTWPNNATVLRAMAEYYSRARELGLLSLLLDRSAKDARRALAAGRLDQDLFTILQTVASLRQNIDTAEVIAATWSAVAGGSATVEGAGSLAGDRAVEEFFVPELLSSAFRSLFVKAGAALDRACAVAFDTLEAVPLSRSRPELADWCKQISGALGVQNLDLYVTSGLAAPVLAASSEPPVIFFDAALIDLEDREAFAFLYYRALKIVQARVCALAHGTPQDIELRLAAFLRCFADNWQPTGLESGQLGLLTDQVRARLAPNLDDDVPVLALEVIGTVNGRTAQIGNIIDRWVNRTALLATGDLAAALRGISLITSGQVTLPRALEERQRWLARNAAARDLVLFALSEEYDAARQHVGLGLSGIEDIEIL